MKVNTIMDKHAAAGAPVKSAKLIIKEEDATMAEPDTVDPVIFPASDRFKHMLKLIARDNKELYNRIVGME